MNSNSLGNFKNCSGLPQGQEMRKSQKKLKKLQKSGKNGGFLKKVQQKSGNLTKIKKKLDISSSNLQNSLFFKAFKW